MTPCYWGLVGEEKHQDHSPKHRLARQQGNSCQNTVHRMLWRQGAWLPEMPWCVGLPKWIVASDGWGLEGGEPPYWDVDRIWPIRYGAKKTTCSSFVFWLHIEYSLRYLRTGLRPSEVSTWPMKVALWDLNLILSGLSFRLWDVKRLSSSRTVLSWSRAAWSIESPRPITIISLAIFSTPSISGITLWRHHWNSSGAKLTPNGSNVPKEYA